ncbi:MAG: LamG-like jellyroll fold domain-containing protein [Verrucomicrobiota bacterium]
MKKTAIVLTSLLVAQVIYAQTTDLDNGLIGYFPLNGNALDYSGNANPTIVQVGASWVAKPDGNGLVLATANTGNADEGCIVIDWNANLHAPTKSFDYDASGSMWVWFENNNLDGAGGWAQTTIYTPPGAAMIRRNPAVGTMSAAMFRYDSADDSYDFLNVVESNTGVVLTTGHWTHVAWTYETYGPNDSAETGFFRWYIDGVIQSDYEYDDMYDGFQTRSLRTDTWLGGRQGQMSTDLKFAEVRFYDRILNQDEINVLANLTTFLSADIGAGPGENTTIQVGDKYSLDQLVGFTDAFGNPLPESLYPDITYNGNMSGPAVVDSNGDFILLGGGTVSIDISTAGNSHVPAGNYTASITVPGSTFVEALWDDTTGTGYYIIQETMEAGVAANNLEVIRINGSGYLGIGTDQPQSKLHVDGNIISSGGIASAGDIVVNQGTANEIVLGSDGSVIIPQQGDISMGDYGTSP